MRFTLGPKAVAAGYRLVAYETIGSTNAEALARAAAGDPGRLWIVAGAQTEGRGRRGRRWETAPGNLAASLLMPRISAARSATLGFAAGLALEHAIRGCMPETALRTAADRTQGSHYRLRLKWPNDVLIDGAKVAGILLEAVTVPGGASSLVIGIGVNMRHVPDGFPYPAASLAAYGVAVAPEDLLQALGEAWVEQERIWDGGCGFAETRCRWLERAAGLGAPIAVRLGPDVWQGTFETIDEEGRLVVRRPDGSTQKISAGDVHLGTAATAGR